MRHHSNEKPANFRHEVFSYSGFSEKYMDGDVT
jgi:hypothetical protein